MDTSPKYMNQIKKCQLKQKAIKSIVYVIVTLSACPLFSQSAFHDALKLKDYLKGRDNGSTIARFDPARDTTIIDVVIPILANYTSNPADIRDGADLNDAYDRNPFISADDGVSKIHIPNEFQSLSPAPSAVKAAGSVPSAGSGPFVSNLADGLAKFLVKRTKEELTITFFQKFKDKINGNSYFKGLFPHTADLLGIIDNEIYQFNAYLETLREHFVKDMKTLPINLKSVLDDDNLLAVAEQIVAYDLLEVAQDLLDKSPPTAIITYLGQNAALQDTNRINLLSDSLKVKYEDVASGFKVVHLLSQSMRSNISDEIWVKPNELRQVFNDKEALYLYLGLLWQKAEDITFSNGTSVRRILDKVDTTAQLLEDLKGQIESFTALAQQVKTSLDSLKSKKRQNILVYDDYYQFFHSTFSLLKTGIHFKKDLALQSDAEVALDDRILDILRHINELNFNVRQKHYAAGVTNLVYVFQKLLPQDKFTFKGDLLKYGNFIAIVAEAEESDEVAAAIEAVALPVGSSITKKYSSFSVALNAYTGLAFGKETLTENGEKTFFAVAAPVGFSFSTGFRKGGSLSLYTPLLDVGAIAALRFDDDNTEDLPDLDLRNIIAPGAYAVYGFGGDIPMAFGLGAQLGPNLRAINVNDNSAEIFDKGWRWGIFLAVDIPIFNLYVR